MAIQFPASPFVGDTFPYDDMVYVWDGEKWTAQNDKAYWDKDGNNLKPEEDGNDLIIGGSITAAGNIEVPSPIASGDAVVINPAGLVTIRRDTADTSTLGIYKGGSSSAARTIRMTSDGNITAAGKVTLGSYDGSSDTAKGHYLNLTDNTATNTVQQPSASDVTNNAFVVRHGKTSVISAKYDGSITASGATGAVLVGESPLDSNNTGAGALMRVGGTRCVLAATGTATALSIKTTGENGAKATIKGNGTASFPNVFFSLEADNPANYVSTTNADGGAGDFKTELSFPRRTGLYGEWEKTAAGS